MAVYSIAFLGSTVVGGPIAGWLGEAISPRAPLVAAGLAGLAVAAAAFSAWSERDSGTAPHPTGELALEPGTGELALAAAQLPEPASRSRSMSSAKRSSRRRAPCQSRTLGSPSSRQPRSR